MKTALVEIFGKAWRRGAVRWSGMNEATVSREISKPAVKPLWAAAVAAQLQLERYRRAHARSQRENRAQKRAERVAIEPPAPSPAPRFAAKYDFVADPMHPAWEGRYDHLPRLDPDEPEA